MGNPGGLVVVDSKARTVRAYGDASTLERFMKLLARRRASTAETMGGRRDDELQRRGRGFRGVTDFRVDAVPHGSEERLEAGWLIERPNYDLLITVHKT